MADDKLADLYKTQQSLTEWLQDINHKDADAIRREDNDKRERLKVLNNVIGLPFDKPEQFEATELAEKSDALQTYLSEHGEDLCALRLIPKQDGLPKLRMRGKTVQQAMVWFTEQAIDPSKYRADFVPHPPDNRWATIFVVNQHGIQGEIIRGGHHQLTQGFYEGEPPITFSYDFETWNLTPHDDEALGHLKELAAYLLVEDENKRGQLSRDLNATFAHNYLEGYFETTDSSVATWFIDYSPSLGKLYADTFISTGNNQGKDALVKGMVGCGGTAEGPVAIVQADAIDVDSFPEGGILVCEVTTPAYVPLMQKAAAIVTDQGGILSHAAIVARELKKPCIVATGNATKVLQDGQLVSVNADTGTVELV